MSEFHMVVLIALGSLVADIAVVFVGARWAGRKLLLGGLGVVYVVVVVIAPLVAGCVLFPRQWIWVLGLVLFMRILDFGLLRLGTIFREYWRKQEIGVR